MSSDFDRRELLSIAGLGGLGVVFGSSIAPPAAAQGYDPAKAGPAEDFFFIQLSDTHWGFKDDKVNPDAAGTFKKVDRRDQCAVAPAGFHRLHRRHDAHQRRPGRAAPPHGGECAT